MNGLCWVLLNVRSAFNLKTIRAGAVDTGSGEAWSTLVLAFQEKIRELFCKLANCEHCVMALTVS